MEVDILDIPAGFQSPAPIERKIDVGFMRPPVAGRQLMSVPLFQEPYWVVLRQASPLVKRKLLYIRHLAKVTLLLFERRISPGHYDRILRLFREQGFEPKTVPPANHIG